MVTVGANLLNARHITSIITCCNLTIFQPVGRSYSHQEMPYFNREFPVLGGGNSGERPPLPSEIKEQPPTQYGQKQIMRNTRKCN